MDTDSGSTSGQGAEGSLQRLSSDECYALLATQRVGRLGVNAEHYPLIFPVNYALDGQVVVVRTHAGTKLAAADHANVSFEVDELDPRTSTGWSVLVRGLAEEVGAHHRDELVARTVAAGAEPWAPGEHDRFLRILPQKVTGRRIVSAELPPPAEPAGYL